ncbi:hypothetical protein AOLI_G00135890, partial [Acnodon oligacanthus]
TEEPSEHVNRVSAQLELRLNPDNRRICRTPRETCCTRTRSSCVMCAGEDSVFGGAEWTRGFTEM